MNLKNDLAAPSVNSQCNQELLGSATGPRGSIQDQSLVMEPQIMKPPAGSKDQQFGSATYFEFEKLRQQSIINESSERPVPLSRAHGADKYYYRTRPSVQPSSLLDLQMIDWISGNRTPRITAFDKQSVQKRIFEKNVYDSQMTQMFSRRSKTPPVCERLKRSMNMLKCMQPAQETAPLKSQRAR